MAIDWSAGYSSSWRAHEVIPGTWADGGEVAGIEPARIERTRDGDAPLLESGTLNATVPIGDDWRERYVRLSMVATQGGESERVDVATLLVSSASGDTDRGRDALGLTGRSVLWPASTGRLESGSYAPAGADGAAWVARLLRAHIAAPVVVTGSFRLASHVVLDLGCTPLEASWLVLRAGGFALSIAGDGTVTIGPDPTVPALSLDATNARLLHTRFPRDVDWSGVPNRYVAIDGDEIAVATNDDPNSPVSTVTRGYDHTKVDSNPVRIGGETLIAYANRRLEEESIAYDRRTYSREWWPNVVPGDLVRASMPTVGLEGDMRVHRQSLSCGAGIVVDEDSRMEVRLWTRT